MNTFTSIPTNENLDIRYHYSKVRHPKNDKRAVIKESRYTLASLIEDGIMYVGISRCDATDNFNKKEGKKRAKARLLAYLAQRNNFIISRNLQKYCFQLDISQGLPKDILQAAKDWWKSQR